MLNVNISPDPRLYSFVKVSFTLSKPQLILNIYVETISTAFRHLLSTNLSYTDK